MNTRTPAAPNPRHVTGDLALDEFPVDAVAYAHRHGVAVFLDDLDREGMHGFAVADSTGFEVTVNRNSSRRMRRIVVAHLAGHLLAHRGGHRGYLYLFGTGCCEDDSFARALLTPAPLIADMIRAGRTLDHAAVVFGVPEEYLTGEPVRDDGR